LYSNQEACTNLRLRFQAKHLQFVSGVDTLSYWLATYTWDFINYLVPAIVILILFAAFQVDSYKDEMGIVFLLLVRKYKEAKGQS